MDKKEKLEEVKEYIDKCISGDMSLESLQDVQDSFKIAMTDVPTTITLNQFNKLKKHIDDKFNVFDADGEIDLDKCQRNVGYSIGNWYSNYNVLFLREKQKLAEIASDLALARAEALHDIKMSKIKYDLDSRGMNIMIEGHQLTRAKQMEYDKQKAYVEYLEATVKQVGFYANSVDKILKRVEIKGKYGE